MCDKNYNKIEINKIFNRELEVNNILFNINRLTTNYNNESNHIENENNLIINNTNEVNNLDKNLNHIKTGKLRENLKHEYINNPNKSKGTGFGDLDISKNLRYGKNSRNNKYNRTSETDLTDKYKFHYTYFDSSMIDDFPIERGGTDTRNIEKNQRLNK